MATFSKEFLSASLLGKPIPISSVTLGGAQTIHTVPANCKDELWLYAYNSSDADYGLTLTIDGVNYTELSVPAKNGLVLIAPGQLIASDMIVKAFATVTNTIYVSGWINRIS